MTVIAVTNLLSHFFLSFNDHLNYDEVVKEINTGENFILVLAQSVRALFRQLGVRLSAASELRD
jgi:hypothetical protein